MSDYISFEIQAEVMKMLPVKSLIRFRSVSKQWKSLIESSEFIVNFYNLHQTHHLLVRYVDPQVNYVSIIDNDTFPKHKYSVTVPNSVKLLNTPTIVGSSRAGLFCLYNIVRSMVIVWNPLISKSVDISVPNMVPFGTVIGFGVCPHTSDIKLIKVSFSSGGFDEDFGEIPSFPWQVEVFSFSSKVWRSPLCSNFPHNSIELTRDQVDIDRFIYWLAYDTTYVYDDMHIYNLIMSFDITSEKFIEISLPDSLKDGHNIHLVISKLKESLVVLEYDQQIEKRVFNVWMMYNGDPKTFTKLFTVNKQDTTLKHVLGFRMSGELLISIKNDSDDQRDALFVYEHPSENIKYLDIYGEELSLSVSSYMESLLLLDH